MNEPSVAVPPAAQIPVEEDLPPTAPGVVWWHIHRRLYDWVLSWAHSRHGAGMLFLLAFAESSFFPIPPDVLQIALTLERRTRAFFYAAVSSAGSVLGGIAGYAIGYFAWEALGPYFIPRIFPQEKFDMVQNLYDQYDFWIIFAAAFTPIPYKIFTIAGGVCHVSLPMFILASIIGRAGRFFLVAGLLYLFGATMKRFIEKYFNLLTLAALALIIGVVVVWKVMH